MIINCKQKDCQYWDRSPIVNTFFNEIRHYPILTAEEEYKLLVKIKNGTKYESEKARTKLIECNQRFIISAARKWQHGNNLMDIVSEANIGLMEAIDNYDINRKQRFLTYAVFWIRKYINNYIVNVENIMIPNNAMKVYIYGTKARNRFFQENNRYPDPLELQEAMYEYYKIRVSHVEDLMSCTVSSIDEASNDDSSINGSVVETRNIMFNQKTAVSNADYDLECNDKKNMVRQCLDALTDTEKKIVLDFYGLNGTEKSVVMIATEMDKSEFIISSAISRAVKKMQKKAADIYKNEKTII